MAGSGDELAAGAGDRNRLRASAADRDQVAVVLQAAFVQGRLSKAEFDLRVTQVFASRTYADLEALTADLPAGLTEVRPPQPVRESNGTKLIQRGIAVGATVGLVIPAVVITATGGPAAVAVVAGVVFGALTAVLLAGVLTLLSWVFDRGAGKKPPQGPPSGTRGTAYQ
jgi:hypothetical protein